MAAAAIMHRTGASSFALHAAALARGNAVVRAVNYHQTLPGNAERFSQHLRWYERHFVSVTEQDLLGLLVSGTWRHKKPGLLLSFDDGLRSNFDVAAPLLEKHGMVGWFFVPTGFVDCAEADQLKFAAAHEIPGAALEPARDSPRVAMSWQELSMLRQRGHVVGVHTATHRRLGPETLPPVIEQEVLAAKRLAEAKLGCSLSSFCWVGGESRAYSKSAGEAVRRAGYNLAFQTNAGLASQGTDPMQVNRVNVEDRWPLELASFQVSGVVDLQYARKRRRIRALTS